MKNKATNSKTEVGKHYGKRGEYHRNNYNL